MSVYVEPVRADFYQLYREPDGTYLNPTGPLDCQAHSASRMVMRINEGVKPAGITGIWPPTGSAIRRYTGDTSGGLTHAQVARVMRDHYNTPVSTFYRLPISDVIDALEETRPVSLSLWYRRIRDYTPRRGSFTFYQNHEIFIGGVDREQGVFTNVVDPLADGRQTGIYKGPGEYPISLIRAAAGELNVAGSGDYEPLGVGLCYANIGPPTGQAPAPPPSPINYGANPMIQLDGPAVQKLLFGTGTPRRMALPKGTVVYRSPSPAGSEILDRLGADVKAVMVGIPRDGWRGVIISTRNFPDGIRRDVIAYVPKSAGVIS